MSFWSAFGRFIPLAIFLSLNAHAGSWSYGQMKLGLGGWKYEHKGFAELKTNPDGSKSGFATWKGIESADYAGSPAEGVHTYVNENGETIQVNENDGTVTATYDTDGDGDIDTVEAEIAPREEGDNQSVDSIE